MTEFSFLGGVSLLFFVKRYRHGPQACVPPFLKSGAVSFECFPLFCLSCDVQKKLSTAVRLFEKRVYYLNTTGSLQIWGTVCEQR